MADKGTESRHGKMAAGWKQQQLQLPLEMGAVFRAEATQKGANAVKILGTLGVGVLLGMPARVREELFVWGMKQTWDGPEALTIEAVWEQFKQQLAEARIEAGDKTEPEEIRWEITRILDPEVTPPPGQKASDKAAKQKAQKGRKEAG